MKRFLLEAALALFFLSSFVSKTFSLDSLWVRTLTFDDITKRRGTWTFPENPDSYRKILMFYTLKCDPRTTHDKYACGEWDYLTSSIVYKHTGIMDSNLTTRPFFDIGSQAPDTLLISNSPTKTAYVKARVRKRVDSVINETLYSPSREIDSIRLDQGRARYQFIYSRSELKSAGMKAGNIDRMFLKFKGLPCKIFNLRIKLKSGSVRELPKFEENGFTRVFYDDASIMDTGWIAFDFVKPFKWNGFSSLIAEISYDSIRSFSGTTIAVADSGAGAEAFGLDGYLYFDGKNDAAITDSIPELKGTSKFTIEAWVRIDKWAAWANIFGIDGKTLLQTGSKTGEVYCIVRNPSNSWGKATGALPLGRWTLLTMVYDGTQKKNEDKLKLYVNGSERALSYNGVIPDSIYEDKGTFAISSNYKFQGGLDEVRVWSEPLTREAIRERAYKSLSEEDLSQSSLLAYYPFDKGEGVKIKDEAGNRDGYMIGCPARKFIEPSELFKNVKETALKPSVRFASGEYVFISDTAKRLVEVVDPPVSIRKYKIEGHKAVPFEIDYAWKAGWGYTYDENGNPIDSTYYPADDTLINRELEYYEEPYEKIEKYEIGRFITPYGIGLDLGPEGFTWVYDVTDYAPLLTGEVDFSAGNQQELIDVRFLFIKGTPPRKVLRIDKPWGAYRSYKYKDLASDKVLSNVAVKTLPEAKSVKIKARLTGHGHYSDNGQYPHCCEWKDNEHFLIVNGGEKTFSWRIFRYNECAQNPVFPQGGTWPGAREGWCPGDLVYDYEFEVGDYVEGDSISLDYDITPVPENNQGMGNGNYYAAFHLIEYGANAFDNDAEVYNVFAPNDFPYYSRINPRCSEPIVVVRNNGTSALRSLKFKYGVSGGSELSYDWEGNIPPNEMDTVYLPVQSASFWLGDGANKFTVSVSKPNGLEDENPNNDEFSTSFDMPDLYEGTTVFHYKTNNFPQRYTYKIKDINGTTVFEKNSASLAPNKLYTDTLKLPKGCYVLEFLSLDHTGLSYWAYPAQGSGYFRIYDGSDRMLKNFNPDFGYGIIYAFNLGDATYVGDDGREYLATAYPNPALETLKLAVDYEIGRAKFEIYSENGRLVLSDEVFVSRGFEKIYDIKDLPPGAYYYKLYNANYDVKGRFVKK